MASSCASSGSTLSKRNTTEVSKERWPDSDALPSINFPIRTLPPLDYSGDPEARVWHLSGQYGPEQIRLVEHFSALRELNSPLIKLEELEQLVDRGEWEAALPLALELDVDPTYVSYLAQQLLVALLPVLDVPLVDDLAPRITDKAWLAATCVRIVLNTDRVAVAKRAVDVGIQATAEWIDTNPTLRDAVGEGELDKVQALTETHEEVSRVAKMRKTLFEQGDKVKTWDSNWGKRVAGAGKEFSASKTASTADKEEEDHGWDDLDLPQDEGTETSSARHSEETSSECSASGPSRPPSQPRLSSFLSEPLADMASSLAAFGSIGELGQVCRRHSDELWSTRTRLLEAIPEWLEPEEYIWLLPSVDSNGLEALWSDLTPWRSVRDWCELIPSASLASPTTTSRRTSGELTAYYVSHIEGVASLGFINTALSLVQHGASKGIVGLDELGEELSLLSKLVYDRPARASTLSSGHEDLTLSYWRSLEPLQVVRAYLAQSSPSNLASTIRQLVLPYLSVLESRLERAGESDPNLTTRLLYEYVLSLSSNSRDLDLLGAIFDSSKPTLAKSSRIIKDDEDLAKIAIASLYGSCATDELSIVAMGKIFECLPAFSDSIATSSTDVDLFALATRPTSNFASPHAIFAALSEATSSSLSYALDLLDLHLSQLETFSRYSSPTPLSWFLTSHRSETAQRAWATRLARTASTGGGGHRGNAAEFESEDEWMGLGEVLRDLTDSQGEDENGGGEKKGMGKAFWLLAEEEIWRIFFGGLLGAGREPLESFHPTLELRLTVMPALGFSLARSLFNPSSMDPPLEPSAVEELVISASREFYDNAGEGNLNRGDMKLAFDW